MCNGFVRLYWQQCLAPSQPGCVVRGWVAITQENKLLSEEVAEIKQQFTVIRAV
jgi:hypothetical protein